jgi:hypothetical protein
MVKVAVQPVEVYVTKNNDKIYVTRGSKSELDFIVKYQSPGKRMRTPKHIHIFFDLYAKLTGNEDLAMKLIDYIIDLIGRIPPETSFPPSLKFFSPNDALTFSELNKYGEYSVEFLLVIVELILRQEKTNYPSGTLSIKGFRAIRRKADIFSIVSSASFGRKRG